jgi:hypothetical protein
VVEIEIIGWEKFNPRKDVNNPSWFRLEHSVMFSPEWDHFDAQEIAIWIYLLSMASFTRKHVFKTSAESIAQRARADIEKVHSALEKLKEMDCISMTSRARDVGVTSTIRPRALRTDERTDVTDETDERISPPIKSSAPVAELRNAFLESYKAEFKRDYPGWGAKENGMAAKWLKSISLENAKRLCALYPKWNDPWVTKQGHPLGILMAQYVQLDAWAQSSKHLIQKIAAGKAAENIDLKRAVDFEESKRGLLHTVNKQQAIENIQHFRSSKKHIPNSAPAGIHREPGDPFSETIFDLGSEADA